MFEHDKLWDEILLAQLPDSSPNFEFVNRALKRSEYDVAKEVLIGCPYLEMAGNFESYFKRLGKNLKHDIAKKTRRLGEDGLAPDFEPAGNISARLLEELRELNRKRFEATEHRSFFLKDDRYAFLRELAGVFNEKKRWLVFAFRVRGRLVAYRLCFLYNEVVYDWNTSFDVEYFKYSLGKILLKPVLSYCFEKGYLVFDFMAGGEDYKLKWTDKIRTNYQFSVRKRNLRTRVARAYVGVKNWRRRTKKACERNTE